MSYKLATYLCSWYIIIIAGIFGGVNVWRIAELKVIGEIKFGEWIDFGHKDTNMHTKLCRFTSVIAILSALPVNKSLLRACVHC